MHILKKQRYDSKLFLQKCADQITDNPVLFLSDFGLISIKQQLLITLSSITSDPFLSKSSPSQLAHTLPSFGSNSLKKSLEKWHS